MEPREEDLYPTDDEFFQELDMGGDFDGNGDCGPSDLTAGGMFLDMFGDD